jgi:hypothetical protein
MQRQRERKFRLLAVEQRCSAFKTTRDRCPIDLRLDLGT